ncbi:hypothetical protein DXG01_007085 [Tephrocybe rancida]|nr:hypothetical protein DXG01_007085 [Tephrocybe rancida]
MGDITENAVSMDLAKEDEAELHDDLTAIIHDDVLPGRLIAQGLELEDHQHVLHCDAAALGPHSTDLQHSKILEHANCLYCKFEAWSSIQQLYIPGVVKLLTRAEDKEKDKEKRGGKGKGRDKEKEHDK